jgi:hypothetical protein
MIRSKIKSIEITEVPDLNPDSFVPGDFENFGCTFGLTVGPDDSDGGELFYLTVCTPRWLERACEKDGFVWGCHHLIVREYNLKTITEIIMKFVDSCSGDSWTDVAGKLSRIANWEFEGYRGQ